MTVWEMPLGFRVLSICFGLFMFVVAMFEALGANRVVGVARRAATIADGSHR